MLKKKNILEEPKKKKKKTINFSVFGSSSIIVSSLLHLFIFYIAVIWKNKNLELGLGLTPL